MSLIKDALFVITAKGLAARETAHQNYMTALKDPEIAKADSELNALIPQIAKLEALGKPTCELSAKYQRLEKQLHSLLLKKGFDARTFEPAYSCTACGDTGYTQDGVCMCLKNQINSTINNAYGLQNADEFCFENSFPGTEGSISCLLPFYQNMQKYCQSFPETKWRTHIFSGAPGTGKTRLAHCVAHGLKQRGMSVVLVSAFKLNDIFLKYHLDFAGVGREYLSALTACDMLIIDDLGTENTLKNVTNEYLLSVLSDRIAAHKHNLITTNLHSHQLRERYDDRLHSRLTDRQHCYVFNFDGCDIRKLRD